MDAKMDMPPEEFLQLLALSQILGGFAHEIAQPHNAVMIAAQVIQMRVQKMPLSQEDKQYIADRLGMITSQIARATNLVEDFRAFGQPGADSEPQTELNSVFGKIKGLTSQQMMSRGIEFNVNSHDTDLVTSLAPATLNSILILALAYARESVKRAAEWLRESGHGFAKRITVDLQSAESHCLVSVSWEKGSEDAPILPDDSEERKGLEMARSVLSSLGGGLMEKDGGSILIEFPCA